MNSNENSILEIETIIVGGGQAGLSVGRYLKEYSRPFVILEKNGGIGQSWESRYDSMVLDSFAKYGRLADFPFPGDQMRQPTKDETAAYLKSFAKHYDIRPQFSTEVLSIEKKENKFVLKTNKGIYQAKFVVLATGVFQKPFLPGLAKNIPAGIFQIHSQNYKNPASLPPGNTLVVGGVNSGAEIAEELAKAGRKVLFSYKGKFGSVTSSHFSQWVAYGLGVAHLPKKSLLGKLAIWYTKSKAVGVDLKEFFRNPNLIPVGECLEVKGQEIICVKQNIKDISVIVWATGYRSDFSIVSIPEFDSKKERRGITNIPGLYILNIRWQYSKSSSHLAGVSRDAKYIVKDIID